jgi:hypothetical protein
MHCQSTCGAKNLPLPHMSLALIKGAETFFYVEGGCYHSLLAEPVRLDKGLKSAARILRIYHDATIYRSCDNTEV